MSVPRFRAKRLLLTQLLHRGIQLISVIYYHCPQLDYTGISDMENILCNIYLILSEVLCDQFRQYRQYSLNKGAISYPSYIKQFIYDKQ